MAGDNPLASTMTDLMTSLMVIFILLLVNFLREEQKEADKGISQRAALLRALELKVIAELRTHGLEVKEDPNDPLALILIVPQTAKQPLFELNREDPSAEFRTTLNVMGPRLVDLVTSDEWRNEINSVVIEGHTDKSAAKDAPFYNLQLSQNRSRRVMELLLEDTAGRRGEEGSGRFWAMTSASGRADRDCAPHMLAKDCRRVQFRIRVKSKEQRERDRVELSDRLSGNEATAIFERSNGEDDGARAREANS